MNFFITGRPLRVPGSLALLAASLVLSSGAYAQISLTLENNGVTVVYASDRSVGPESGCIFGLDASAVE